MNKRSNDCSVFEGGNSINLMTLTSFSSAFLHKGYKPHQIFKTEFYISLGLDIKYICFQSFVR